MPPTTEEEQEGNCVECRDSPAYLTCEQCKDDYCELCFKWIHSRGNRREHVRRVIPQAEAKRLDIKNTNVPKAVTTIPKPQPAPNPIASNPSDMMSTDSSSSSSSDEDDSDSSNDVPKQKRSTKLQKFREEVLNDLEKHSLLDRCKYIPLRLTEEERNLLHTLEGALDISEYTDNVDVADSDYGARHYRFGLFFSDPYDKHEREGPTRDKLMRQGLKEFIDIIYGLYMSSDFLRGSSLLKKIAAEDGVDKLALVQRIFEVGRRYKIMNPDKMRTTYGKMMFILQDALYNGIESEIRIPVNTVYTLLEDKDSLHLLSDPEAVNLILNATHDLSLDPIYAKGADVPLVSRSEALKTLLAKYTSEKLSSEDIIRCVNSIADNNTFITLERVPVDKMLNFLTIYFTSNRSPPLDIHYGRGGSKLSHDHGTQFAFVLQSLMLWREIITNMFRLWFMTEEDMLLPANKYQLRDTGQGLNRQQGCPHVGRLMHSILGRVQQLTKGWVGLSVVHLADRDVPNALVFIDKYTQVSRILGPITLCIEKLDLLNHTDSELHDFFERWGGVRKLQLEILQDYFKHGFDGSGSDGGSCIDGRLTSSWNWCSKIEKKSYFHLFLLTGFKGFDGSFR